MRPIKSFWEAAFMELVGYLTHYESEIYELRKHIEAYRAQLLPESWFEG